LRCLGDDTDVLATAALMAHTIAVEGVIEHAVVERLVEQGYSRMRTEVLVVFVPLGLYRAVIAQLPARPPIALPEIAMIQDYAHDRTLKVRLANVPEFVAALELGEETFVTGVLPREHLDACCISVELNLINEALNAGKELGGSRFASPYLLRLAETPGFEEWYQSVTRE
jgi:hypothetical protein